MTKKQAFWPKIAIYCGISLHLLTKIRL